MKKFIFFFGLLSAISAQYTGYATTLYWRGGTGYWHDITHWFNATGGQSQTPPYSTDDVIFDQQSSPNGASFTVKIDGLYNADCKDMDWSGCLTNNPVFFCAAPNNLYISGSLTLAACMTFNVYGSTYFTATNTGNTITTSGKVFSSPISFIGLGGGWKLTDDLEINSSISHDYGILDTDGHQVKCPNFYSNSSNPRTLKLGSSLLTVSSGVVIGGSNLVFNCGTSVFNMTSASATLNTSGNLTFNKVLFTEPSSNYKSIYGSGTFNYVKFAGSGRITDNCTFDSLVFTAGKVYLIYSYSTQTITSGFACKGNCASAITIQSSSIGSKCTFKKTSGTVQGEYLVLKDCWATGGATFTAASSIDLGNTTGWNISSAAPLDLYWVGNGGNWDDPNHWAIGPTGSPPSCVPTSKDNVFFNQNSFDATSTNHNVVINIPNAYCRNMTWTGVTENPSLKGEYINTISIYGSLTLDAGMSNAFQGIIYFESTSTGKTIKSCGQDYNNSVFFRGIGGGWTLLDSFDVVNSNIHFLHGSLFTNNQEVSCYAFYSDYSSQRTLQLGSSVFNVEMSVSLSSTNLNFDCGTSLFNMKSKSAYFYPYSNLQFHDVVFEDSFVKKALEIYNHNLLQ